MAVDFGTANTLVYVRGRGIVLSEPSVVAVDSRTGEVHAVGLEAKRMLGRTPGTISAIRPLKDGVIADFDVTEQMLRHFIQKVHQNRFAHPRVVVCVPSGVTGVEKRAVEEACLSAGARQAYLIEEPMAAAIGAGLPVSEPMGSMVVDIGGGTSEVAVISLGGIVVSQSIRIGGDEMDEAIVNHCKHRHKLLIGSADRRGGEARARLGVDPPGGDHHRDPRPRHGQRPPEDDHAHLRGGAHRARGAADQILNAVKDTLDRTPPELAGDIMDRGITLAGGGALLQGMEQRLREECQMPAQIAESPLTCVAVGSGRSLEEFEAMHRASKNSGAPALRPRRAEESADVSQAGPPPPGHPHRPRRLLAAVAFGALQRGRRAARCTRSSAVFATVFSPIEEGASSALKPVRDLINWFDETFDARGENDELHAEVAELREQADRGRGGGGRERRAAQAARPRARAASSPATSRSTRASSGARRRSGTRPSPSIVDRAPASSVDDPVVTGDGLVGRVSRGDVGQRSGDVDHRPPQRRLGVREPGRPAWDRQARGR